MIRTVIEVTGETDHQFESNLKAALSKLGYEEKPSQAEVTYRADMYEALREKGINIGKLVEEFQSKRLMESLSR